MGEGRQGGLPDKDYPWGDGADVNRANHDGTGINDTSAVGCFPANGYGLSDMSGNVWEWTSSLYKDYPYDAEDGRENPDAEGNRVVRGGAWYLHPDLARCAYRVRNLPDNRDSDLGFRVLLRSSPV